MIFSTIVNEDHDGHSMIIQALHSIHIFCIFEVLEIIASTRNTNKFTIE